MSGIRTVGIKDLKNQLSAWLREVRRGTRVLVADRGSVVAELREPGAAYETEPADPVLAEWARVGAIRLPTRRKEPLPESPIRLPAGLATRLLDEAREDRRR
jgi:antitoxin (DNA-binding transcriptional repressor) of toxin-antitoxin stability system